MSSLITQSTLNANLNEKDKKKGLGELNLGVNSSSAKPLNPQIQVLGENDKVAQNETNTNAQTAPALPQNETQSAQETPQSANISDEDKNFALYMNDNLEKALKTGASKKEIVGYLRENFKDDKSAEFWAFMDEASKGDDEFVFDAFKNYTSSFLPQKPTLPENKEDFTDTDWENYEALNPPKFKGLKDTSKYEQELQNRGFLNQSGQKILATFGLNLDKSEHDKIRHNIKEKLRQGGDESDLSELEKRYLTYINETDSANKVINAAVDLSPTDFFANLKNNIFSSVENKQKDELQAIKNELKDENDYKNAVSKIKNGVKVDDLSDDEKMSFVKRSEYYDLAQGGEIKKGGMIWRNALKQIKDESELVNLKSIEDATPEQIKKLANMHEFLVRNNPLNDDKDLAEEALSEIKARFNEPERAEKLRSYGALVAKYDTIDKTKQLTYAITSKLGSNEKLSKDQQDYLDFLNELADKCDFDGIGVSNATGELGVIDKEGNFYTFKDGGIQNFLEIMGASKWNIGASTAGYIYGSKKGKTPRSKFINSIIYGLGFGIVGSGADYVDTALQMDTKFDGEALIHKAVTEGALQLVFDGLALGVNKLTQNGKSLINAPKKAASWVGDNTLAVGALRNLRTQNLRGAESILAVDKELKKGIDDAYELYGGRVGINETQFLQKGADKIKAKFGENSKEAKLAQGLSDMVNLRNLKDRQNAMIEYIRADESGRALGFLTEVASRSPLVQQNLKIILNKTSADLTHKLENLGIQKMDIKKVYDDLASATESSYNEVMDDILAKLYPKDIEKYKASIDTKPFEDLIAKFKDEKTLVDDASKIFKKDIIDELFSGEKLSFTQLNNVRKNLNAYTRDLLIKRPSFQNTLSLQLQKELRTSIDNAIKDIFRQNPVAFSKASELYETALKDYADMKGTLKIIDNLKSANTKTWEDNAVKSLINYAKGQGDDMSNLARLTQHLAPENRAVVEMNILKQLFEKSRFIDELTNIDVFDSGKFLEKLSKLTGKNGEKAVFESTQAKEMVQMVNEFHTLFKKDADIARRLSPARTGTPAGTSSIATNIGGKVNMARVKMLWEMMIRNLPEAFWLPKSLNEAVKGAALRYHLHHALSRSGSVSEFKQNFSEAVKRTPHTPQAQKIIKDMNKAFDEMENLSKDLSRMSDEELILREKFGKNYAEFKGKGQEAVNHLLKVKSGQVQGAFFSENLAKKTGNGEIDLVFGDENMGLSHILKKHGDEFVKFKGDTQAEKIANALSEIIEKGKIIERGSDKINIEHNGFLVGLNKGFDGVGKNRWIVTAYDNTISITEKNAKRSPAGDFTGKTPLSPNSVDEIIPNSKAQSQATPKEPAQEAQKSLKNAEIQGENQTLDEKAISDIKNASKEQLENNLKSIEAKQAYNKQTLDYYKQNFAENSQQEIYFIEKQLLKDAEKQKLIAQRLDELKEVEKRALKGESGKAVEATPSAPASKDIIDENGLKLDKARQILKENVNFEALNDEQKGIFEVFTGQKDRIILQGKDINDLYTLEQGSRNAGAKKILIKHAGVEKTGGLSNDELLNIMKVVREGELDKDSFILADNKMRYAYDLNKDGVKLRLVVDEYNDGRKVFDYYSDRNFTDYGQTAWQKMQKQQTNFKESGITAGTPAPATATLKSADGGLFNNDNALKNSSQNLKQSQGEPKKVQIEMTTRDINRKNKLENENKILEKQIQEAQKEYEKHLPKLEQLKQKENEAFQKWRLLWDEPKKENPSPEALKAYEKLEKEFRKASSARQDFDFNFLGQQRDKINNAKSQISKNQQSLEKLMKKYEDLQMQSDISAKELLEHNVIDADFVRARDSVIVNENIIQKAERENFKLPDNIFQYENRELEIQPNIAKRYLGAHAHNQNELEKAMTHLVDKYIERFIQYRGGGLKSVGKEKALERLSFLDNLQREIQYEKEALSGGENAKKQVLKGDESAENLDKAFEFSTPKESKSAFAMRKEVREVLEPVFDKPLTNANDGRVAVISKKKSSKLSSSKAAEKSVENGFSEAQHFETAKHLPELYEKAIFRDTMPDKNGYDNLQIHHYTADFMLDGEPAQAKITLKETIDGKNAGNRIYTIELESVAKLPTEPQTLTKQNAMSMKPTSSAVDTPTANPKEIIPKENSKSQIKNKKEIINRKLDIIDEFDNKQYELWNSELHKEFKNLQDEIDKTLGKNLGMHNADISDNYNALSFLRYDTFNPLFNEAKIPYESCKKLKTIIRKGKDIDFNDIDLSPAINTFDKPLLFVRNYAETKLNQPFRDNLFKKIEQIFKKIDKKSQANIKEFKKALKGAENAVDRSLVAEKTAHFVDNYAKTAKFKSLSNEKQRAILSLKDIKPSQMPDELAKTADFENVVTHFDKKLDSEARKFYLKLFEDTKNAPDIVLESAKNENIEYIKAFQHTQTKDLYYLAFTQKNGITKITGIPTTQIRKVIKDIAESKKVLNAEDLGGIKETAEPTLKSPSPQLVDGIIPKIQNKFKQSEQWAKNLFEWHKDSSPLTKEADGTPKVFYHATSADKEFEIFDKDKIHSGYGFWFGDDIKMRAVQEAKTGNAPIYKVFLKMKKPFEVLQPINKDNYKEFEKIFGKNFEKEVKNNEKIAKFEAFVKKELNADEVDIDIVNFLWSVKKNGIWKDYRGNKLNEILTPKIQQEAQKYLDKEITRKIYYNYLPRAYDKVDKKEAEQVKQRLIKNGYDSIKLGDEYVVFDSNQIKAVNNKGAFDGTNPNILMANQHLGAGLLGGTINGLETDENGNVIGFSPEKFVAGFLGGAGASKALSSQFAKKYATITSEKIKKSVQNSLENLVRNNEKMILQNPQGFIKELDKKGIAELLNSKGNIKMSVADGKNSLASEIALNLPQKISKAERKRLELFGKFVENSLENSNFEKSFNFGTISKENAQRLNMIPNFRGQKQQFDLSGYSLDISARDIRHIKNNHPDDLDLLNNLYDIYHNFDKAQWDIIRDEKTGKAIVSISFFKEYKDGTAKAVEVKVNDDKKLKLKTLFRVDKGV